MSVAGWRLQEKAERAHLYPWLARQRDPTLRLKVLGWLSRMSRDPQGYGDEERPGVFTAKVPGTHVVVVWALDPEAREIILAIIGDD